MRVVCDLDFSSGNGARFLQPPSSSLLPAVNFTDHKFPHKTGFLPGPSYVYLLTRLFNRLDLDPSYPKNPTTLGEHIRKWRMDKGFLIKDLAKKIGITEDTVINWEMRGVRPAKRYIFHLEKFINWGSTDSRYKEKRKHFISG